MNKIGFHRNIKHSINLQIPEKKWFKDFKFLLNLGAFIGVIISIWISQCHHNQIMKSAEEQLEQAKKQFNVNINILKKLINRIAL